MKVSFFRLIIIIFFITSVFSHCNSSTQKPKESGQSYYCDLVPNVEKFYIDKEGEETKIISGVDSTSDYYHAVSMMNTEDFVAKNLTVEIEDKEGTAWRQKILDKYRFIWKNESKIIPDSLGYVLLVYKNGYFYKKFLDVEVEEERTQYVNKNLCKLMNEREQRITYFSKKEIILTIIADYDRNKGSIYFSLDGNRYSGIYISQSEDEKSQ